jgi:hypothetical protein
LAGKPFNDQLNFIRRERWPFTLIEILTKPMSMEIDVGRLRKVGIK